MARYYFHLRDRGSLQEDLEGDDLAGDAQARDYALLNAREALRTRSLSVQDWLGMAYEITDEAGRVLMVVPFADAIATALP